VHKLFARVRRLQETFWIAPAVAIGFAIACGVILPIVDRRVTLPDALAVSGQEDTARAVLAAIATIGVSVAGVSFSVIVVALVLASQQLSPRVLRSFQRQPLNQAVLALLLGTATYALFVLSSLNEATERPVPELAVTVAMLLAAASLGLFVIFLHHAVRSLNASTVIRRIAAEGHESVEDPYPSGVGTAAEQEAAAELESRSIERRPGRIEARAPRAGYIASVDGSAIVRWASEHDAFVQQSRGIGDFALTRSVLAVIHHDSREPVDCRAVTQAFLLEEERVVDGDIAFPVRQLADIALKGLSPGINDPTTAENAMDSVTDTLVRFAERAPLAPLRLDDQGEPRLLAIVPTLDRLVRLGFDEVRRDGANRPSFAVRLLELLADLEQAAPAARTSREVGRQAALIARQAAQLADQQADQELVSETFERLHGTKDDSRRDSM
jgi:uncharacterized membrane protein